MYQAKICRSCCRARNREDDVWSSAANGAATRYNLPFMVFVQPGLISPMSFQICLRSLLALSAVVFTVACGTPDERSFVIENVIFDALLASGYPLPATVPTAMTPVRQAAIARGLSAICQGQVEGAGGLLAEAGIGKEIFPLVLIAAKANRKGNCDYSQWLEKRAFLGERFKQLVGAGDAPSVLLAAMLDEQLPAREREAVVQALADQGYGHARTVLAAQLLQTAGNIALQEKARAMLLDAIKQGAVPAHVVLARIYRDGQGVTPDVGKACAAWQEAARLGAESAKSYLASPAGQVCVSK